MRTFCTTLLFAALCVLATVAIAEDKPAGGMDAAAQQAWMAAMTPGEHHKHLEKMAGNFDYVIKSWMDPASAPIESKGKRVATMELGGRFLEEKYTGDFMGMPFEGIGTMGYDNISKKYVGTWIDNMTTGMMTMSGQCDEKTHTWTMQGDAMDPMTGKPWKSRNVTTMIDADNFKMEMYAPAPDGKEFKMMEITMKRTK